MSANALGVIAAVILLASFVLRGEKNIRLVNLVGCVFLVLWAVRSNPTNFILVFMGIAIILVHLVQFWHMIKEAKSKRELAKAEAKVADAEAKAADAQVALHRAARRRRPADRRHLPLLPAQQGAHGRNPVLSRKTIVAYFVSDACQIVLVLHTYININPTLCLEKFAPF